MEKQINENGRSCSKCNEFKNWSEYYKDKSQKTGFVSACKSCLYESKNFKSDTIEDFLEQRIDKDSETGCWNWAGHKNKTGYGVINNPWYGKFGTPFAHRISYIVHKGPIEKGMFICHTCDNPKCINPLHLYEGTAQDNVDDRTNRGRHGHRNELKRKLTDDQVKEIRKLSKTKSQRDIAKIYKVSQRTVCNIINNKTYKDVL